MRDERPQSDRGKGYYWTLNVARGEGNKRDRKLKDWRDKYGINDEDEDTDVDFSSEGTYHSISASSNIAMPAIDAGPIPYDMGIGHFQNIIFQTGNARPPFSSTNSAQSQPAFNPSTGMIGTSVHPVPVYDFQYLQPDFGSTSSHRLT